MTVTYEYTNFFRYYEEDIDKSLNKEALEMKIKEFCSENFLKTYSVDFKTNDAYKAYFG